MQLVAPSVEYKDSFIEALREAQIYQGPDVKLEWALETNIDEIESSFEEYVEKQKSHALGLNQKEGYVPATTLWLVDKGEYIGRLSIRHRLNERLEKIGGHIGYDVRPSKRHMGYGGKILELALPIARALGIDRLLLTCNESNIGSRKIIERSGGQYENSILDEKTGHEKLRYWIDLR